MLRCLLLDLGRGEQCLRDLEKYRPLIDAVEIVISPSEALQGKGEYGLVQKVCRSGFSTIILSSPYPGERELEGPEADGKFTELLQPGITHVGIPEGRSLPGLEQKAGEMGIRKIRTIYEPEGIPVDMVQRVRKLAGEGDIPRINCRPGCSREVLALARACGELQNIEEKIITPRGLFAFFGKPAPWLFGSMMTSLSPDEHGLEHGELNPEELEAVYRFSDHGSSTKIYGIIGNPVMHTRSPHLHNRWFGEAGLDAVYLPFHVDEVVPFMKLADLIGVKGFSVTVPHKQAVIPELHTVGPEVLKIGSCNTVVRTQEGWSGSNTDYEGFLRPLERSAPGNRFKTALVIGAGGAARAVVYALVRRGIDVLIVNRTADRANSLAMEMGVSWQRMEEMEAVGAEGKYDLIVQTTSAGMYPDTESDPLPGYRFSGNETVYDIIYAPEKTRFLSRAEEAGSIILGGKGMLEAQAERQFELFRKVYSLRAG